MPFSIPDIFFNGILIPNVLRKNSCIACAASAGLAVSTTGTYVINPKDFNEAMEEIYEYINNRTPRIHREELMALL